MAKKRKVTLIQSRDNVVRRVRIDDVEIDVVGAMPTITNGLLGVSMVVADVDLTAETELPPDSDKK